MSGATHGLRPDRMAHLRSVIQDDIARGRYHGAVIKVARGGEVGIEEAIGSADAAGSRPLSTGSVFSIFSTTKAMTNVLVFRAIELGQFALTTKVGDIIPEFSGGLRAQITIFDLLTHSSGLPGVYTPKPGMYIDRLDEIIAAICENLQSIGPAQGLVDYSPMAHHALLGEAVRRTDPAGRSYRQIAEDELFRPLRMDSTAIGRRADLKDRHVIPDFRGNSAMDHLGSSTLGPNGAFEEEHAEMPWVGAVCTTPDLFRFAEMLRLGGELDGARIISPAIIELATRNWTGDKPNEMYKTLSHRRGWRPFPAYMGLGFALRGTGIHHHLYGTLCSPETFGNYGAGSSLFWIDPVREITFAFNSAGVMNGGDNFERFQRLSDIATSAAI
jgi:CubicO group peptidase (beta-lactamase class C family)